MILTAAGNTKQLTHKPQRGTDRDTTNCCSNSAAY